MVLAPEPPLSVWFAAFDAWLARSPGFFNGRPVVLDLSALETSKDSLRELIKDLFDRNVRVIGMEGVDPADLDPSMPPILSGATQNEKAIDIVDALDQSARDNRNRPNTLLIDSPVRSGQCVGNPNGDVIVVGSVASGAEIIAGGSIHIYGTLRGRAIAGCESASARIFCRKLEAELLSIDGHYMTADEMGQLYRGRPVQIWLDSEKTMMMTALD
jgi:septum site-determining protein MinC